MGYRIEFACFKLVQWALLLMRLKSVQRLGSAVGYCAYYIISSRRKVALSNLRHAFPELAEGQLRSIAKGSFRNYGIALFEFFWFPNLTPEIINAQFRKEQFDGINKFNKTGKPLISVTGHFGNWELLALSANLLAEFKPAIIVQTQSNKYFDAEINKNRSMWGSRTIPMGISIREIMKTLAQKGGVVALAGDQSGAKEAVYVEFFGRNVSTHQGPAVFALKCNAPIFLSLAIRKPDHTYDAIFEEVPMKDLGIYNDENVKELTQRHVAILESYIRKNPGQWLWMHRRWKYTMQEGSQEPREELQGI